MNQQAFITELAGVLRRDRLRRSRWSRFGSFLGKLVVALATGFLSALTGGWMFMLGVGVIHAEWLPQLPTLGYWWAVLIAYLLRSALASTSVSKPERTA